MDPNNKKMPIRAAGHLLMFAELYLQTPEAMVWVGRGIDPPDNDDERVRLERELMARYYPNVPYGMSVGNRQALHHLPDKSKSYTMVPMELINGFYVLDTSWWPVGVYRLNYHTLTGVESPVGTPLNTSKRDHDVSWPQWWQHWPDDVRVMARPWMHKEANGGGSCFRILIRPDKRVEPLGDSPFLP